VTLYSVTLTGSSAAVEVYGGTSACDDYLLGLVGAGPDAYAALSANSRARYLVAATRYIDRQRWQGTAAWADGTTLVFPRDGLEDENGDDASDAYQLDRVSRATFEMVAILVADADAAAQADQGQNIKSMGAGSARLEFFGSTSRRAGTATKLPTAVHELIGQWLAGSGGAVGLSVAGVSTGTESDSFFDECDRNERSEAF